MCGRYEAPSNPKTWSEVHDLLDVDHSFQPAIQSEVRPTDPAPVLRNTGSHALESASWWLRGVWDVQPGKKLTLFNARDDRLGDTFWRDIAESRRCLIPAVAYVEWQGPQKIKNRIAPADGSAFAMAGLWNSWQGKLTSTIITTSPTPDVAHVHDRMPVILPRDLFATWLSPERVPVEALLSMIDHRTRVPLRAVPETPSSAQQSLW